jgi:hypothetical protein
MSQTELFDFPIKELPERYSLARSAVYVRMKRLNITPHTQGNRSYINASELDLLDDLHDFLCEDSGRTIDDFLRGLSAVELTPQALPSTQSLPDDKQDIFRTVIERGSVSARKSCRSVKRAV